MISVDPIIMPQINWAALPNGVIRTIDQKSLDKKDPVSLEIALDNVSVLELLTVGFILKFDLIKSCEIFEILNGFDVIIVNRDNFDIELIVCGSMSHWLRLIQSGKEHTVIDKIKEILQRTKLKKFL